MYVLAGRLQSAINKKLPRYSTPEEAKNKAKPQKKKRIVNGFKVFPDTSFWRQLNPGGAAVQEPANPTFLVARAPTISEKDAGHVPNKYNFTDHFDVPPFTGMKKELLFDRHGKQQKDSSGKPLTNDTLQGDKGCINPDFKHNNELSANSSPGKSKMCSFLASTQRRVGIIISIFCR